MELTLLKRATVKASCVRLSVAVKYDEDDMPTNFPGRIGDLWTVEVNLDNGKLTINRAPFPPVSLDLHMKVTDCGVYTLFNHCGEALAETEGYVPGFFPGKHYGDYLILDIADGKVKNWDAKASEVAEHFQAE